MALGNLYDVGAGAYDATVQGDVDRANQQKLTLANQHSAVMNPLLEQNQVLTNQTAQATLPGIVGQSQSLAAKGNFDQATLQDKIKQAQSDVMVHMNANQLTQANQFGQTLLNLGSQLQAVPPAARASVLLQATQRMGIDSNNPQLQVFLKSPPDRLPDLLSATGKKLALSSQEYLTKSAEQKQKDDAAFQRTKYAADHSYMSAGLRAGANTNFEAVLGRARTAANQHALLISEATRLEATNPELAASYMARAKALEPQAQAELARVPTGRADVSQMGLATVPPPKISQDAPSAAPTQDSFAYYRKLYPDNISDQQIREAYKAKTGKELK